MLSFVYYHVYWFDTSRLGSKVMKQEIYFPPLLCAVVFVSSRGGEVILVHC